MEIPFEFCALKYFLQWEQKEKGLHDDLIKKNPSRIVVRKALNFFQVARNFKGLKSDEKVDWVLTALQEVSGIQNLSTEARVEELATRFKGQFQKFNLSAASKLLWLKYKSPYIVCDSRAVTTLKKLGSRFNDRKYSEYCEQWRAQYQKREPQIKTAASRLVEMQFFPVGQESERALVVLIREAWFLERIFDIYLWERAGETWDDS